MTIKVLDLSIIAITLIAIIDYLFLQDYSISIRIILTRINNISYISSALSNLYLLGSRFRLLTET